MRNREQSSSLEYHSESSPPSHESSSYLLVLPPSLLNDPWDAIQAPLQCVEESLLFLFYNRERAQVWDGTRGRRLSGKERGVEGEEEDKLIAFGCPNVFGTGEQRGWGTFPLLASRRSAEHTSPRVLFYAARFSSVCLSAFCIYLPLPSLSLFHIILQIARQVWRKEKEGWRKEGTQKQRRSILFARDVGRDQMLLPSIPRVERKKLLSPRSWIDLGLRFSPGRQRRVVVGRRL